MIKKAIKPPNVRATRLSLVALIPDAAPVKGVMLAVGGAVEPTKEEELSVVPTLPAPAAPVGVG